ncbi:MAG: Gfo/Idh/MocA family oxidoreductase [Verrucomicrobiales bacterium]
MPTEPNRHNRRSFLKGLTASGAAAAMGPNLLLGAEKASTQKLGIACIGVGGKGFSDMKNASKGNDIVAICDVDAERLAKAAKEFPQAKTYVDFREMLEKENARIDGVTVSTPDHTHYPAAMHAISLGKHVMVQKPLVNTLWEADELHKAAKKKGIITQMGNQGHTYEENRVLREWFDAGVVGKVKEIHVWTNRPVWPQGHAADLKPGGDAPEKLDWKLWLSSAPDAPYAPDVHPFKWRGLFEYGAGALGDMGCHNLDPLVWALGLGVPNHITAVADGLTDVAWPRGAKVEYLWKGVKGHGDIKMYWYEGRNTDGSPCMPPAPKELKSGKLSKTGFYVVGEDGILYNQGDQASNLTILPEARSKEFLAKAPEKKYERSPSPGDPQLEWSLAIKQGKAFPFMSQFDYAVPLTELCLLGNLAIRTGKAVEWDQKTFQAIGNDEANKLVKRAVYREGWEYSSAKI